MAFVHRLGQRIGDASTHPDHGRLFDAELHGDGVGRLEADAADVAGQPVGVFRHDLDGVGAIGLVDAHCPRRADAVAVQEHHDLADDLLLGPGNSDAARPHRADAVHLPQAVGLGLDDVEHLLPEGAQQLLGIDRADAADHARGKVLLDAFDRCRRGGLEEPGLELLAMGAVVRPVTGGRNPLTGGNHGGVANDRDEIAVTTRLDPNDAKAVVGILVGDALNQPGQHFPIRWLRLRLHDVHRTGLVAETLAPDAGQDTHHRNDRG